jgi:uncharacterized membrane protein
VLVLTLGFAVVALLLVAVVVDASKLFLTRRALAGAADAAALAGAQAADLPAVYSGAAAEGRVPLDPASVDDAVVAYIRSAGLAGQFTGLALVDLRTDGTTVSVTLAARAVLPLYSSVTDAPGGVPITVTASARSAVR